MDMVHQRGREPVRAKRWMLQGNLRYLGSKNKMKFTQRAPKLTSEYLSVRTATLWRTASSPPTEVSRKRLTEPVEEESQPQRGR